MYQEDVLFIQKDCINVSISDFKISTEGSLLKTTLGSCVSVVFFTEKKNSICSMSHYLLPYADSKKADENLLRYGEKIIPIQIQEMEKRGIHRKNLLAKVAGGATMFPVNEESYITDVGSENSKVAFEILKQYNIPVLAQDVGGKAGRSIRFDPDTLKLEITIFGDKTFYI